VEKVLDAVDGSGSSDVFSVLEYLCVGTHILLSEDKFHPVLHYVCCSGNNLFEMPELTSQYLFQMSN